MARVTSNCEINYKMKYMRRLIISLLELSQVFEISSKLTNKIHNLAKLDI